MFRIKRRETTDKFYGRYITMRIFKVTLGYAFSDGGKAQREKDLVYIESLGIDVPTDEYERLHHCELIVSENQLLDLVARGIKYERAVPSDLGEVRNMDELASRLENLVKQFNSMPDHDVSYNQHVEVHIPNSALHIYNETLLLEDACTDQLQDSLDSGWRIIACCPQAARRPDYILGRFNPERTDRSGARRES